MLTGTFVAHQQRGSRHAGPVQRARTYGAGFHPALSRGGREVLRHGVRATQGEWVDDCGSRMGRDAGADADTSGAVRVVGGMEEDGKGAINDVYRSTIKCFTAGRGYI